MLALFFTDIPGKHIIFAIFFWIAGKYYRDTVINSIVGIQFTHRGYNSHIFEKGVLLNE